MARVNMVVGTKGGIGKSLIACMLAEYLVEKRGAAGLNPPMLMDIDPTNGSFSAIEGLGVKFLDVLTNDDIDRNKFDVLVENVSNAQHDDVFVIDTGSNAYIPLMTYMSVNAVPEMLMENGAEIVLHIPIMGGSELVQTVRCMNEVCKKTPKEAKIAVWLNGKNGSIEFQGKSFENMDAFKNNKARVKSIIRIYEWPVDMAKDIAESLKNGKTFLEAAQDANATVMTRQRMKMARRYMFERIEASGVCE